MSLFDWFYVMLYWFSHPCKLLFDFCTSICNVSQYLSAKVEGVLGLNNINPLSSVEVFLDSWVWKIQSLAEVNNEDLVFRSQCHFRKYIYIRTRVSQVTGVHGVLQKHRPSRFILL